jgi:hypothetical protein
VGDLPRVLLVLAAVLAVAALAVRCGRRPALSPAGPLGSAMASASSEAPLVRIPDFSPDVPVSSPWAEDPVWQRAGEGDPIDLARLAQREGAAGLLDAIEAGGKVGLVALRALPWADDAELVLGRICAIAERTRPDRTLYLLEAIRGVLAQRPRQAERLDGAGRARCGAALEALVGRAQPALARDLAASAQAVLNEARLQHE